MAVEKQEKAKPRRGFWSGQSIRDNLEGPAKCRVIIGKEVTPKRMDCAAYELSVGPEYYVSATSGGFLELRRSRSLD